MTRDLLMFGEDWGSWPSATQHLARHLSADRKILWVNSIGLRRPRLNTRDLLRLFRKGRSMLTSSTQKAKTNRGAPTIEVLAPIFLPLPGSRIARDLNRAIFGRQLKRALERMGMSSPVLWASLPSVVDLLEVSGEHSIVYYCGDDFAALPGVDHHTVSIMERQLVDRSDLIIVPSAALASRFPAHKTLLLAHGVDFDLFSSPAPRAPDLPLGQPIAGYYGSVSDWLDLGMLSATARAKPDWHFVFVGEVSVEISELVACPNVSFLGPRLHSELPKYSQHWDASIIPFVDNAQIRACNPLKLREYLAAGTPIVSTRFPAVEEYRELIEVVAGGDSFAAALDRAARDTNRNELRRARVAHEGWQQRAAEAARAIASIS